MIARSVIAIAAAGLIAVQVVRNAAVEALAESKPSVAGKFWSGHPAVEISSAMIGIAQAARDRRPAPGWVFPLMADAASKAPLAAEPFLVRGVEAQLAGSGPAAQHAFEVAQSRDPRSLAAAYFLADRYLRTGDREHGLNEIAALSRLSPKGAGPIAPYVAAYARDRSNWPALRRMFLANSELAQASLIAMASSTDTIPAVLALADPRDRPGQAAWLPAAMNTLVQAGEYTKAHEVWSKASGAGINGLIHDASFADKVSPPPFNWSLTSSAVGLTERQAGGRLHVVFYGQQDGILASQLLLLQPGSYRLSYQIVGDPARSRTLNWSLWCDKASSPISSVTLDAAANGWRVGVPAGCPAQWLKLSGSAGDISQEIDVTIGALKLERMPSGA